MIFDTIVGISTKLGESAVNIVRISGDDAVEIVNGIFRGSDLSLAKSHTVHYGKIMDKEDMIDEVMVNVFLSPRSFTTENTCEISCHGGYLIANEIVRLLLKRGARLATNGEFTRRAYLNGRIDLTQAESIMDMIQAKTKEQLRLANKQLLGEVMDLVAELQGELLVAIAGIEVNIDYPEYDDAIIMTRDILVPQIQKLREKLDRILVKSNTGKIIREGVKTVIVGKPNVGKSSLLNSLLNEDKAIVTEVSGTTRDLIEAEFNLSGILLKLIDTAGIRHTDDIVEKIGIQKTKSALSEADLVLLVLDQSQTLTKDDHELLELTKDKKRIIIGNKMDLGNQMDSSLSKCISISAKNRVGIEELENEVRRLFVEEDLENGKEAVVSNTRHIALIQKAYEHLGDALESCEQLQPVDMIEIDLRLAWNTLGEITGEISNDTLIDTLFSKFCLGK